jgi:transglutaminase-like putative cysteine protease
MFTFSKGISSFQPEKTEIKKRKYIEAVIPGVDKKMTKITGDFGKSLNHPGNLAPFPTKSLQPMIKLKLWGIIGNKQVNLHSFYLQEGPLTQVTNLVRANAELIANGSTTEETVKNILEWLHSALQIGTCDNHRDAVSADHLIQRRCLSGCTDYTIVFAALARAKGISATVTETVSEKWIAEMVWNNSWNPSKEGHFYSEVYLPERSAWIVVDPTANQLTGRDNNGYYVLNGKRYLLFERGLDPADYGLITDAEFAGAVKKKYYVEPGDQP